MRRLLAEVDAATERVAVTLTGLDCESFSAPSRLPGWSRATIAAHLTWVAGRYVEMTAAALAGQPATTYPGGPAQREATLHAFDGLARRVALDRFRAASVALARCWDGLDDRAWQASLEEARIGPMRLSRLVALRLTELEVHHLDVGRGYWVDGWSPAFVEICLPLRLAWLGTHHRPSGAGTRPARWLFAPTDRPERWLVTVAAGGHVHVEVVPDDHTAGARLSAPSRDLLAFVLGRIELGDRVSLGGAAFKEAFPGP